MKDDQQNQNHRNREYGHTSGIRTETMSSATTQFIQNRYSRPIGFFKKRTQFVTVIHVTVDNNIGNSQARDLGEQHQLITLTNKLTTPGFTDHCHLMINKQQQHSTRTSMYQSGEVSFPSPAVTHYSHSFQITHSRMNTTN